MAALAGGGYPVGLTIAPVMPVPNWQGAYGQLLDDVAAALVGVPELDLTAEIITHRFTPGSKEGLLGWYPQTSSRWTKRDAPGSARSSAGSSTSTTSPR